MPGSSLLARGILALIIILIVALRITPACAGSTHPTNFHSFVPEDHPRLRGEYTAESFALDSETGSPPLARGVLKKACIYVILIFYLSIFPLT